MNSLFMSQDRPAKLLVIALIAGILFNFPIIYLAGDAQLIAGIPKLYLYIFLAWLLIILLTFLVIRFPRQDSGNRADRDRDDR